jgi:hypothetical protein
MSVQAMNWAFSQNVPPPQKVVLLALANRANPEGVCWPSHALLAGECSMSERSIARMVTGLRDAGLIDWQPGRLGDGRQTANRYFLNMGGPDRLAGGSCEPHDKTTLPRLPDDESRLPLLADKEPTKETKEEPKGERARAPKPKAHRLPEDWEPNEKHVQPAFDAGKSVAWIDNELAKFRDHWAAKAGPDAMKLDWGAAFRKWLRTAMEWQSR